MKEIKCTCGGSLILRNGIYGDFFGCEKYPECKRTLSISNYIIKHLKKNGINIYGWDIECWKCKKEIMVYSYFLNYDLTLFDDYFFNIGNIGIGDILSIDQQLLKKHDTINVQYSRTLNTSYVANTCKHCGALQGHNFVVTDPHPILNSLWHERDMEKYLIENIDCKDISIKKEEINYVLNSVEQVIKMG